MNNYPNLDENGDMRAARPRKYHELKTWPEYFTDVLCGFKTFEVRKNDRDFRLHDILVLKEWDNMLGMYTGREVRCCVDYILYGGKFGIEEGHCVMGITWAGQSKLRSEEYLQAIAYEQERPIKAVQHE